MPNARRLRPYLFIIAMCLTLSPAWSAPAQPLLPTQPDLPPLGRSRFDQLIGNAPVPFPYTRLAQKIQSQMQADPGGLPPLKATLIPLGRSLQKNAGAPDFFRFPRVVAAADGSNRRGALPLRDRLFIGYHETGEVLEVISYNDAAGRFEFQVVRDYAPGKTPQVYYARRSLCLACHQNAAPIFARPLWDETPANPAIARRLRAVHKDFYGVKLSGTDIAYFIDAASERASLFSVWQTLWQQGCGADDACRMQALAAALDYARNGTLPGADAVPALARNWISHWPHGLPIPNPDLPNRDPLAAMPDAANDPLLTRSPLAVWHAPDTTAFIVGLAGMLDTSALHALPHDLAPALQRLRAGGALTARPFNAARLQALLGGSDVEPGRLPRARTEADVRFTGAHTLFRAQCGLCHDSTTNFPPNFLHGDDADVSARLDHCAERIFYRLSMAKTAEAQRARSPMPPPAMLAARGIDAATWARSHALAALLADVRQRLRAQGKQPDSLLAQPFEQLRVCLPAP